MSTFDKTINSIKEYLHRNLAKPLFVTVNSSADYLNLKSSVRDILETKRLSDFCANQDDLPDYDNFINYIKALRGNIVVTGVGEHLSFFDCDLIDRLKDIPLNTGKAVIICRHINNKFVHLKLKPFFRDYQYVNMGGDGVLPCVTRINEDLILPDMIKGYKNLLSCMENGESNNIIVSTSQKLAAPFIDTAYACIKFFNEDFNLPEHLGEDSEWKELLAEVLISNSLGNILAIENFDIHDLVNKSGYELFKMFLALKLKDDLSSYLKFVVDRTNHFEELKKNILLAILKADETSKEFKDYYNERKRYLSAFSEADLALFVAESRIKGQKRIHYLTDIKHVEKQAIIECLSTYEYDFSILKNIYPDLYAYTSGYTFINEMGEELTKYFNEYKRIKVRNILNDDFLNFVMENAKPPRKYLGISTRNKVLESIENKNSILFFIDSMGIEFISFIKDYAARNDLSIEVNIAIANLPSITTLNKDFYEKWTGEKYKTKELDDLKHKGENGFDYTQTKLPIHLEKELDIIKDVLDRAKAELLKRKCDRVILSSDHGSSRLCVLNGQEISEETDNRGEYSGRCCAYSDAFKIENATEENGYLVLADYGRFKGSRAAQVEVHGGATWEEVFVPVIELSLKNNAVTIRLHDETVYSSFRKRPIITIFSTSALKNVSVVLNNKTYFGETVDENNHRIVFDNLPAKTHEIDVFAGDNYCGRLSFTVKKESGDEKEYF